MGLSNGVGSGGPGEFRASLLALGISLVILPGGPAHSGEPPLIGTRLVLWGYSTGVTFQQPRGVAFDPGDGAIYVCNSAEHRIEVFSKTGRPLSRFVHRVSAPDGETMDGNPVALAFDRSGRLLVIDRRASYVDVIDRRGRPVTRLSIPSGQAAAVAVAGDGTIYVGTNAERSRVYRFRPDYAPDGGWGVEGAAPGCLNDVAAMCALSDSAVAVACEGTDLVVQIFSPTGEYRRGFGTHEVGDGNFSLPSGMAATDDGRIWVLDEIRRTLQVFDKEGEFVARADGSGTPLGQFLSPSSLASDGRGLIALTDRGIGRVQVFGVQSEQEGGVTGQRLQP